jgi:hypothetical protein
MNMEALAPFVAGPASAVFVMLLVLVGLWKIVVDKLIPLTSAALNRHLEALDRLVATNQADHQAIISSINGLDATVRSLETKVTHQPRVNGLAEHA